MYRLYGIPNCDTVKKARVFLEKNHIEFSFIDFKKTPPTTALIKSWSKAFGGLPINAKGATYKKHRDEYEALNEKDKIVFLTEHSSMIKRPILEDDSEVLGFGFEATEYATKLGV